MEGPFARSQVISIPDESLVAEIIWEREGRDAAISIAEIIREARGRYFDLDDRRVKGIVHELRRVHRVPIGSRRGKPAGYFRMVDAEDVKVGLGAYRRQLIEGWEVLRAVAPREWLEELRGQLRLDGDQRVA